MKKSLLGLFLLCSLNGFPQQNYTSNIAYGLAGSALSTFTVPILPGLPITYQKLWWQTSASICIGQNNKFYVVSSLKEIYHFDPLTCEVLIPSTSITGLLQHDAIHGLAFNRLNNKYYIVVNNGYYPERLYELNINTGATTLVGETGTSYLAGLTIDCDGNCYTYDSYLNNAYKINLVTGAATLIGPLGFNPQGSMCLDYDRENGILYISADDSLTDHAQLRKLDMITGETTLIADWGYFNFGYSFAIAAKCYDECSLPVPFNPSPAAGSFNVPLQLDSLRWQNGQGGTHTEVYFGKLEGMHNLYDGAPISSFPVPALEENSLYVWRIKTDNDTCSVYGSSWMFGTMNDPQIDTLFADDFENGLEDWQIDSIAGYCIWEIAQPPYQNNYMLPASSSGGVMTADADYCGAGTTLNTRATINQSFDCSPYYWVWIEFDSDWKNLDWQNHATIDVSLNNGNTWTTIWDQYGNEIRSSSEIVNVSQICAGKPNVRFRFRSDQNDWDWWWVIDNLRILGLECPTCTPRAPSNLYSYHGYPFSVKLHWADNSFNEDGFSIERKQGDSLSANPYEVIGTTSQDATYFTDSTAQLSTWYTYRVNAFNENGFSGYSNCSTIFATNTPVEFTVFTASQSGNEVELNWTTATELNNLGFEVQRKIAANGSAGQWASVGFIKGSGTTTEPTSYFYHDKINQVNSDSLSYRLRQVDFDGSYSFSGELSIKIYRIPSAFKLYNNFPNPFNPTTTIRWDSPVNGSQILKVYDMLGREVAVLSNGYKSAGSYEVEFDASILPSGIYFFHLSAGSFEQTKKMILVK